MDISAEIAAIQAASQGSELRQPIVDALTALNTGTLPAVTASDAGKILKVGANGWEVGEKSGYMPVPSESLNIFSNGTHDVTNYAEAVVNVQPSGKITITQNGADIDVSSYALADVNVDGGATLVAKTITENGTYDPAADNADGYSSVVVNVEGGGVPDPYYLLNPIETDLVAANSPQIQTTISNTTVNRDTLSTMFAKIVCKYNWNNSNQRNFWISVKGTYNGVANTAFLGRNGYDRCGMFFTTKISGGVYSELHLRYEITSGAFSGAYFKIYLQSGLGFSSDVWPDSSKTLYEEVLADNLISDNEKIIDISDIADDFYVAFGDYSGYVKIRALWFEV